MASFVVNYFGVCERPSLLGTNIIADGQMRANICASWPAPEGICFEDSFNALSPNHDFADDDDEIQVRSGDKIPGIPEHQFKFLGNYELTDGLHVGFDVARNSRQFLRGDESNQMGEIDGYTVANLRLRYAVSENLEIFATVQNLFDKEFETFGLLGEEPNELEVPIIEDLEMPIFLGAAPPLLSLIHI